MYNYVAASLLFQCLKITEIDEKKQTHFILDIMRVKKTLGF